MFRLPVLLAVLALASAASAQHDPTARLGLSAAPDRHVGEIAPEVGEPFQLFVILTGMEEEEELAFDLASVEWRVHTACCGDSPVGVVDLVHGAGLATVGDPYESIISTADPCLGGAAVVLATVTFDWLVEGETGFLLSAGSLTGALACDGTAHLLRTLTVTVDGRVPTPAETRSWSDLKNAFAGEGGTP